MLTYSQSEKVRQSCLQAGKGKIESAPHVTLHVVYEKGKPVPTLAGQAVWYINPRNRLIC